MLTASRSSSAHEGGGEPISHGTAAAQPISSAHEGGGELIGQGTSHRVCGVLIRGVLRAPFCVPICGVVHVICC